MRCPWDRQHGADLEICSHEQRAVRHVDIDRIEAITIGLHGKGSAPPRIQCWWPCIGKELRRVARQHEAQCCSYNRLLLLHATLSERAKEWREAGAKHGNLVQCLGTSSLGFTLEFLSKCREYVLSAVRGTRNRAIFGQKLFMNEFGAVPDEPIKPRHTCLPPCAPMLSS
jgi:hypothetical protein